MKYLPNINVQGSSAATTVDGGCGGVGTRGFCATPST